MNQRPPAPKAGALPGCATPRLYCLTDSKPLPTCDSTTDGPLPVNMPTTGIRAQGMEILEYLFWVGNCSQLIGHGQFSSGGNLTGDKQEAPFLSRYRQIQFGVLVEVTNQDRKWFLRRSRPSQARTVEPPPRHKNAERSSGRRLNQDRNLVCR